MLEKSQNGPGAPADAVSFPTHAWQVGHDVAFYGNDGALTENVVEFLATAVRVGQPIIVIATAAHRRAFAKGLSAAGIDIDDLVEGRDRVWLDAEQTLSSFMVGDRPSAELFQATIGNVFARLKRDRPYLVVRAYGEMVDVLWRAGKGAAALELEMLWNALAEHHAFWLLCGYSSESLEVEGDHDGLRRICDEHRHSHVRDLDVHRHFPVGLHTRLQGRVA